MLFDLNKIEKRLSGGKYRWSAIRITKALAAYESFMTHAAESPVMVIPTGDVDEVWHLHILDTRKYLIDCHEAFGRFIHHTPFEESKSDTCGSGVEANTCGSQFGTCGSDVQQATCGSADMFAATCGSDTQKATCSSDEAPATCGSQSTAELFRECAILAPCI